MEKPEAQEGEDLALKEKVLSWLENEGYPLEFAVADLFQKNGFLARHGQYVRGTEAKQGREIDIVASKTVQRAESAPMLRASYIVECKWSKDKPWVVLASSHTQMTGAACASQMITSKLAEAALWAIAGDQELHTKTTLFKSSEKNGFNGRQALSNKQDIFYSTMQSIVEKTYSFVSEYREAGVPATMPRSGVVAFTLIVIDGKLFQAAFDEASQKIELAQRECFWNGSSSWQYHATVDIVTIGGLDAYLNTRKSEIDYLLGRLVHTSLELATCCGERSLQKLTIMHGPRGVIGLPALLYEINEAGNAAVAPQEKKVPFALADFSEGRFRSLGKPLGVPDDPFAQEPEIYLSDAPVTWIRLAPSFDQQRDWLVPDLKNAILTGGAKLISGFHPSTFRASDGFGLFARTRDSANVTPAAVFASKKGEIWSVDTYLVEAYANERNRIPRLEPNLAETLRGMYDFLCKIGVEEPFQWVAGIEGILGKRLFDEEGALGGFRGSLGVSVLDKVVCRGSYNAEKGAQASLEGFFIQLWDACGAKRLSRG